MIPLKIRLNYNRYLKSMGADPDSCRTNYLNTIEIYSRVFRKSEFFYRGFRMRNLINMGAGVALAVAGLVGTTTPASAQSRSTMQDVCTNMVFAEQNGRAGIRANCKSPAGTVNGAFVELLSIENVDGRLTHLAGVRQATFHKSCNNIKVVSDARSGIGLTAKCQKMDQSWIDARTNVWDIVFNGKELKQVWKK